MLVKNSNNTRDLPTISAVPHPTAPPRDPLGSKKDEKCMHTLYTVVSNMLPGYKNALKMHLISTGSRVSKKKVVI